MSVQTELQRLAREAGKKIAALDADIQRMTRRRAEIAPPAPSGSHSSSWAHHPEATRLHEQISRARSDLTLAQDERAELLDELAQVERMLRGAQDEQAHHAEAASHRAEANALAAQIAKFDKALDNLRAWREKVATEDVELTQPAFSLQTQQFLRSVLVEVGLGDGVPPYGLDDSLVEMAIEHRKRPLTDKRDEAIRAASECELQARVAKAARLELTFAEATAVYLKPLAAFVRAYREAYDGSMPRLPDLKALASQALVNREADTAEPARRSRLAFWR